MFIINSSGAVIDPRIKVVSYPIAHGDLKAIHGIVVHQTDSPTAEAAFNAYKRGGNGAHFLIDKDGTIYQTLSLKKKAHHVGWVKSRCIAEHTCSPAELRSLNGKKPGKGIGMVEIEKAWPHRYPLNSDSIGIEIVGQALPKDGSSKRVFELVTEQQQSSLKWLIRGLTITLKIRTTEIFRHPDVSWKNETEAASAKW